MLYFESSFISLTHFSIISDSHPSENILTYILSIFLKINPSLGTGESLSIYLSNITSNSEIYLNSSFNSTVTFSNPSFSLVFSFSSISILILEYPSFTDSATALSILKKSSILFITE